jgi:hypothetical protein
MPFQPKPAYFIHNHLLTSLPHVSHLPFISHKCIGAKLRILLHCFPLNSCPTTPLKRLPIGSPPLLINTQALSSNLTTLPSGLEYFFAVRTITACRMSPRRTLFAALTDTLPPGPDSGPKFRCFCTTTTMRSPTPAARDILRTLMHSATAAPELSITFSMDW